MTELEANAAKPARSGSSPANLIGTQLQSFYSGSRRPTLPLKSLSPASTCEATETAQRFLASAHDTVEDVLKTRLIVRQVNREADGKSKVGAPSGAEQDLLRAAVVFSGAGLDATLKQLVRDGIPELLEVSATAQKNFEGFVERDISGSSDEVRPGALAKLLVSASPRDELLNRYMYDLTGSSLQSVEQVHRTVAALGVDDKALSQQVTGLRAMFVARNEIAHELDLKHVREKGDRTRRIRQVAATETLCYEALEVGQCIVNAVTALLGAAAPASVKSPGVKKSVPAKTVTVKKAAVKKAAT